ncbi:MAG: hypothetical protein ABMA25_02780, partial [Ilumatobacteraceae bacterium]
LWDVVVTTSTQMTTPTVNAPNGSANQTSTNSPTATPSVSVGWSRITGQTNRFDYTVRATFTCVYPSGNTTVNRSWAYRWDRPSGGIWAVTGPTVGTTAPA